MALLLPRYVYANVAGSPAAAQPHPGAPAALAGQTGTSSCLLPAQHTSPNRAWLVQAPRFTRGGSCTAGGSPWPTALSESVDSRPGTAACMYICQHRWGQKGWRHPVALLAGCVSVCCGGKHLPTACNTNTHAAAHLTMSACGLLLLRPACPCVCVCLRYAVRMVLLDLSQPPPWFVQQQAHDHLSLAAAQAFAGTDGEQQEQGRPSRGGREAAAGSAPQPSLPHVPTASSSHMSTGPVLHPGAVLGCPAGALLLQARCCC